MAYPPKLPQSFLNAGFLAPDKVRKFRRLMLGTQGRSDSGKTEFAISAPGPGVVICLDRGYEAMLDNQTPPPWRRKDFAFKVVKAPLPTGAAKDLHQAEAIEIWKQFRSDCYSAIALPEARTIVIDGDSDSWELQRFAEFGRINKVPSHMYDGVNAARRSFYARLHDSGKNIIATNKIKKHYVTQYKPDGTPILDERGGEKRIWDGTWERQGFGDQEYLWAIQLDHFWDEEQSDWAAKIIKCKPDKTLEGYTLRGEELNFAGLVQTVYPHIPLSEWGL